MVHPSVFRLAPDAVWTRAAAERLFRQVQRELRALLPASAEILHVGATAIPGCLTKGDLDLAVRVEAEDFAGADARLAAAYARNAGSARSDAFASFEDPARTPHLGIQLTVKGGEFDVFHRFVAALRSDAELLRRYNAMKLAHHGRSMDSYRAAKHRFVAEVLRSAAPRPIPPPGPRAPGRGCSW